MIDPADPIFPISEALTQLDIEDMSDGERMLRGYGLTTARFFYRMPDFKNVLNEFVWQFYDLAPDHPTLFEKIEWWKAEIEGPLHSIVFVHRKLLSAGDWRQITGEFAIN